MEGGTVHRTKIREATETLTIFLISAELEPLERLACACMLVRYLTHAALFNGCTVADCERAAATAHTWSDEDEALKTKKAKPHAQRR